MKYTEELNNRLGLHEKFHTYESFRPLSVPGNISELFELNMA